MATVFFLLLLISLTSASLLGGWTDADVHDEKLEGFVNTAVEEISAKSNSMFRNKLVKITNAKMQVRKFYFVYFYSASFWGVFKVGSSESSRYRQRREVCV